MAAILKVTSLKTNRLLPMATINMHMKFEIEIPKQTWLMVRKPCRLQTDGRTDKVNPVYPPPTSLGGGIIIANCSISNTKSSNRHASMTQKLHEIRCKCSQTWQDTVVSRRGFRHSWIAQMSNASLEASPSIWNHQQMTTGCTTNVNRSY